MLHGRNEKKLQGVRDALLQQWPTRQIRILVLDARIDAANADQLKQAAESLSNIHLRILVNNVGGTGTVTPMWAPLSQRKSQDICQVMDITARFPTEITRVLLPLLTKNQPSLILNIGSGISDFASPYIEVYAGAKAYNQAFSRSLGLEMQAEGLEVEVILLQTGMVSTDPAKRPPGLLIPSARYFARCGLDAAACGREVIWPYWPHALQFGLITSLPQWLRNKLILAMVMKEKAKDPPQK